MYTNIAVAQKPQFYEFLVVECCISLNMPFLITLKVLNPRNKSPKIFAFDISSLKCCPYLFIPC